jgi:exonuclease VII large subunit
MGQDKIMDGDSRFSSSSTGSDKCLMAREENVISSTHTPIVAPSHDKLMKFCASTRGVSRSMFKYLMELIYEKEEAIIELNTLLEEEDRKSNLLEQELEIDKESIAILTKSNEMYELKVKNLENLNDKCNNANATNSISCEASIPKENVELKAQLELLTSNYRKLEENHEKLSGSHGDLLVSYNGLKLAHEASITMNIL